MPAQEYAPFVEAVHQPSQSQGIPHALLPSLVEGSWPPATDLTCYRKRREHFLQAQSSSMYPYRLGIMHVPQGKHSRRLQTGLVDEEQATFVGARVPKAWGLTLALCLLAANSSSFQGQQSKYYVSGLQT